MHDRRIPAMLLILVATLFVVSGLRFVPAVLYTISPPICGPLTDQYGKPAGNAGPCPSLAPIPSNEPSHWEWAPFWVARD